ncbi:hypothetical protein [Kordiimonas aquimaris]|uniref:hypothetical protein n=1 Tax=Kordiimonas aquimaris TaxID=707591 RepID=UPI0021D1414E|nr:hypothetical protein [Kordiimonas aquimaris]
MFKLFAASALISFAASSGAVADGLFETLSANCGKAFQGKVVRAPEGDPWREASLVMHIRDCSDTEIKIPLHYNDNRSRVWIVTRIEGDRLRLKHDHRHENGHHDAVTNYGGETAAGDGAPGDKDADFIVDAESVKIFYDNGNTRSPDNVWSMAVNGTTFTYGLVRPDLDFMAAFDLTKPIAPPPPAWDLVQ